MSKIWLKEFGGMVPRIGEQHLSAQRRIAETGYFPGRGQAKDREIMSWPHATEAENCHLFSGELRPLKQPQLTHTFCRPDEECWRAPIPVDPSIPPPEPPEPPPGCVPVVITQQLPLSDFCKEYACDAVDLYWAANATSADGKKLIWPVIGQYSRNGGVWQIDYLEGGGWNNDANLNRELNITVPTLPEDDTYGVTPPGLNPPVFCPPGGVVRKRKYGRIQWPTYVRNAVSGNKLSLGCLYWQETNTYTSLGSMIISFNGSSAQFRTGNTLSNGNPAIYTRVGGINGAVYELPTDTMCAVVYEASLEQLGGTLRATGKIFVNGVLASTSSADYPGATFSYWWGFGLQETNLFSHVGIGTNIDPAEFYAAYQQTFTDYVDPDCA